MLAKKAVELVPVSGMPAKQMTALRAESRMLIHEGREIHKVTNATQYENCSDLRARAKEFKANVDAKFAPIIEPLKQALDASYALRKEVVDPILEVDKRITDMMKEFKRGELAKEQKLQAERREEAESLRKLAEAKRVAEAEAQTAPMRKLLGRQIEALATQVEAVESAPAPPKVQAAKSGTRAVKKWRVTDLTALLAGVVTGDVPTDIIAISNTAMARYLHDTPAAVAAFPGVEVYEDVLIYNR